jgi:hypothetical protein
LPSNNAEEADDPSVDRVKLEDRDCAYDEVEEAET